MGKVLWRIEGDDSAGVNPLGARPQQSTKRDVGELAVRSALSAVPVAGGPLAEVADYLMGRSMQTRTEDWLDRLAEAVREAGERLAYLETQKPYDDPAFVDAVVIATRAAQATHDALKLDALQNAVVNTLSPRAPAVDQQARFIRLVDQLTGSHLRLLAYLNDPGAAFARAGQEPPTLSIGSRFTVLSRALPDFATQEEWAALLYRDLESEYLVSGSLRATQTGGSLLESCTTELGKAFLAFVGKPE